MRRASICLIALVVLSLVALIRPAQAQTLADPAAAASAAADAAVAGGTVAPQLMGQMFVGYAPVFRPVPLQPVQPVVFRRNFRTPLRNAMFGQYGWGVVPVSPVQSGAVVR